MFLKTTSGRPCHGLAVLLSLALWLGVMNPAMASTVYCTTREDQAFKRLVTTCSDGSRAVTRYDRQFDRWRTEIVKPGKAGEAAAKKAPRR